MVLSSLGLSVTLLLAFKHAVRAQIDRKSWSVSVDSAQSFNPATYALDGDTTTFWHTQWQNTAPPLPHNITMDMKASFNISALTYLPRQDGNANGRIGSYAVDISADNVTWVNVVPKSTWVDDDVLKKANFAAQPARFVRLKAFTEAGNRGPWTSAAEINVLQPANPSKGVWSAPITVPLVPAAAAVVPSTGKVLMWAAKNADLFSPGGGNTDTSTFDPSNRNVDALVTSNTGHDMFCPGISLDKDGKVVVTGGNDSPKTSIYNAGSWSGAPNMNMSRGYQAQTTLSNGKIFTIGGSWSGTKNVMKNGEIYDGVSWQRLDGCTVSSMLTADKDSPADNPNWRRDNHGWLFGYKDGSVFQAGPSKQMNWYKTTTATGSQLSAGTRGDDADAMNGNAIMYDGLAGKILTVGGAPNYQNTGGNDPTIATKNAHVIQLNGTNSPAITTNIAPMNYPRAFANSVVLPDGNVFVTGGQLRPKPFSDKDSMLLPELWNATTQTFTVMNPMSIPRNYHSVALLLPDATVLNGGGGLCSSNPCINHFDIEIFSPPYLFNADGSPAGRPDINDVSSASVVVGSDITVKTSATVSSFALVRYASATHSVNTDQRRIPLQPKDGGSPNGYTITIPSDSGVAIPGYWMLFALTDSGVPSKAKAIQIRTA